MTVLTTEPGVQLYTANFIPTAEDGGTAPHLMHNAFCLETQHYPDSPNQSAFPSTLLRPGEVYETTTVHLFQTR